MARWRTRDSAVQLNKTVMGTKPIQMRQNTQANHQHGTRISAVMSAIQKQISARSLTPGDKLPSIRAMAKRMQVSTSTVVEAYERLLGEGLIRSRPGSGFYVVGHLAPLSLAELGPQLDRAIDPLWISRQSLDTRGRELKPGCGWLPPTWMPDAALRRTLRKLARAETATLADYGTPLGLPALRQLLARQMVDRGIELTPDQIMLTESGSQAIDLLCRFLLEPGDCVVVDDPCYFNFCAMLRAHRVNIVSVPFTPNGPDIDQFTAVLAQHRPRLYITNSALHNPTGATLSPVTAHRLLKLAEQHDLTIIEDDIFADFEFSPSPRLAALDGLDRVITIGSFSKTLSASARCGYIAAKPEWIDQLVDLKIATSFGGNRLSAELVLKVLQDGTYRKHMEGLRRKLLQVMGETSHRLKKIGIVPWLEPKAGIFLWCQLPEDIDAADIARDVLAENIVLAPGNAFSLSQTATGFLRFNVAQSQDQRIYEMLRSSIRKQEDQRRS